MAHNTKSPSRTETLKATSPRERRWRSPEMTLLTVKSSFFQFIFMYIFMLIYKLFKFDVASTRSQCDPHHERPAEARTGLPEQCSVNTCLNMLPLLRVVRNSSESKLPTDKLHHGCTGPARCLSPDRNSVESTVVESTAADAITHCYY